MTTEEEQIAINNARRIKAYNEATNDLDRKYAKESYMQPERSIKSRVWQKHFATDLYIQYKKYIRGVVADFGYDISSGAINHANTFIKSEIPKTSHKLNFITINLLDLPCDDEMFDFAFSCHVLEHIYPEDVEQFMNEMCRTIKPGEHSCKKLVSVGEAPWCITQI